MSGPRVCLQLKLVDGEVGDWLKRTFWATTKFNRTYRAGDQKVVNENVLAARLTVGDKIQLPGDVEREIEGIVG